MPSTATKPARRFPVRRRKHDDGEDDGPEVPLADDDSLSEASAMSGDDEESVSEDERSVDQSNGPKPPSEQVDPAIEAMRNGTSMFDDKPAEEVSFDDIQGDEPKKVTPAERRRKDHDDYRKKRDADPAFVPNRGAFFMHDVRHAGAGANGFRPFGRGRGRGRAGPFSPAAQSPSSEPSDMQWTHDMHQTVTTSDAVPAKTAAAKPGPQPVEDKVERIAPAGVKAPVPNRSLSCTAVVGNVSVRVSLPGMQEPIISSSITLRQYTRLPTHRPPLRRDKPVRISIPNEKEPEKQLPKYAYPDFERSFIFIPRAQRPNQQNSARGRMRNASLSGYGSYNPSIYAGSTYTPSIAMSRRSSRVMSPTGSVASRMTGTDSVKPVVRLPPQPGMVPVPFAPSYPTTPQTLAFPDGYRKVNNRSIPMHQPRPQKTVSVADIESPNHHLFQQQHEPFFNQIPSANGSDHNRSFSHPSQLSGTPLSQIPESAIHAAPFQPNYQGQMFVPNHPVQQGFYYAMPSPNPPPYSAAVSNMQPMYMQQPYVVQSLPVQAQNAQNSMVAQEQNGMVYYYDPSQLYHGSYPQVAYPVPIVPQGQEGYYYPQEQNNNYYTQG